MNTTKLRVGVIGTGAIAQSHHLPYWKELETEGRVELVGVCDVIEARVQAVKQQFDAQRAYTDAKKMLRDGEYDIIDICTQNRLHAPQSIMALEAGAHVLVEKPMALSVKQGEQMIAAANQAGRKLMVAQHMRFEAAHEKLKDVVDRGEVGQVYAADAHWLRRRGIPGWGRFHIKKESLGGPLIDIGVHMLDLCIWLMGSPKPVAASGKVHRMFGDREDLINADWGAPYARAEFDVEDYASAYVRFETDITLHLEVSWAANIPKEVSGIRILGDKAGISTNPLGVYGYEHDALTSKSFDWLPLQEGHRMEIRHFTECIEQDKPVRVQPEESLNVQKIIDAIYLSSERNRDVLIK
jgi:predicted dehydrogenase